MSQNPTLELQQSFKESRPTSTTKSPPFIEKSRGRVRHEPRPEPWTHDTKRTWKLPPAKVRLEISGAGTASVVDGRPRCCTASQPEKKRPRSSGITYLECSSRDGLAQKLRVLASSLEKESDNSLEALLREIEVFVGDVRTCVKKAEQKALTSGFYGQLPRITMESF